METLDGKKSDFLKEVFIQNWEHGRHIEKERLWITQFYFILNK